MNLDQPILTLVENHPDLLDFLIVNGFDALKNKLLLKTMGKTMTLKKALTLRQIDVDAFSRKLEAFLAQGESIDHSLNAPQQEVAADVDIKGVLPCPIHMPLRDAITAATSEIAEAANIQINMDLRSANLGISWMTELPDIITSAGFELFFGKEMQENYLKTGIYSGGDYPVNEDLKAHGADLKDPLGHYHILGLVPAIFIINKRVLNGRAIPTSWKMLLEPEYAASVAIPIGDLDLFNSITLTIMAHHGEAGIRALGRSTAVQLHPSQMTAHKTSQPLPLVSVAPYFFSQMVNDPEIEVVWPSDGAIVSPIFMMAKMNKPHVRAITDQLAGKAIGEIFSLSGKFPSTAVGVDNQLSADQRLLFAGWDYLNRVDVEAELARSEALFKEGFEEAKALFNSLENPS